MIFEECQEGLGWRGDRLYLLKSTVMTQNVAQMAALGERELSGHLSHTSWESNMHSSFSCKELSNTPRTETEYAMVDRTGGRQDVVWRETSY